MKKLLICLLFAPFFSCHQSHTVEDRLRAYIKDTLVKAFDDPSSYQFVSLKIDTFRGSDFIHNERALYVKGDTLLHSEEIIDEKLAQIDSLSKTPGYADSIWNYQAELKFRGKNKMGALILDKVNLKYIPVEDKVEVMEER